MKTFKELSESPVGMVGRTKETEASDHIMSKPELLKQFKKIVKQMGGKTVMMQMMKSVDKVDDLDVSMMTEAMTNEAKLSPTKYLRQLGYKIKSEDFSKKTIEIEFFKKGSIENAIEELKDAGFDKDYSMSGSSVYLTLVEI